MFPFVRENAKISLRKENEMNYKLNILKIAEENKGYITTKKLQIKEFQRYT